MGIIGGLFLGWFLGLFGFKGVMIAGMAQLFGVQLTVLGYYFMFAMMGFIFRLVQMIFFRKSQEQVTVAWNDVTNKFNDLKREINKNKR